MSSLSPKDRVSLCSFTFSDGRSCQTPRFRNNSRFCPYHAQKEARARAAQSLGKELTYFFSGNYLSACDLSTALGRLVPAVIRGDVKPRTARTVAYMAQTLLQAIHLSKHEYVNAFGYDAWRQSISNSVNSNHDYLFPPAPTPEQPAPAPERSASPQSQPQPAQTPVNCHSERSEESAFPLPPPIPNPNQPQPHNRPHRRTLPSLPRAPNSFNMYWRPVFRGFCGPTPSDRPAGVRPHNHPPHPHLNLLPSKASPHHLPLPKTLPSHLPKPNNPSPPLLRSVILSVAKDLNPYPPPNSLSLARPHHSLSTRRRAHPRAQTGTPLGGTSATPATSPRTAISFKINTYKPPRKC